MRWALILLAAIAAAALLWNLLGPAAETPSTSREDAGAVSDVLHTPTAVGDGPLTLTIHAAWADGSPFEGHAVVDGQTNTADEDGTIEFSGLTRGIVSFQLVSKEGTRFPRRSAWLPEESEFDLVLGAGWNQFSARVVSAASDEPAPGAEVSTTLALPDAGELLVRTRSDADGRFTLRVPARAARLNIEAPGFAPWVGGFRTDRANVTIRLIAESVVEGTVRRAGSGEPMAGITVYALPPQTLLEGAKTTCSGADGRYRFGNLPRGVFTLFARGEGAVSRSFLGAFRSGYDHLAVVLDVGETIRHDLVLQPGARVSGRLLDAQGVGVAGAEITAPLTEGRALLRELFVTTTGDDGSFRFEAIPPGVSITLQGRTGSGGATASAPLTGSAGEQIAVDLTLPEGQFHGANAVVALERGLEIDGHVLMPDGSPATEGKVRGGGGAPVGPTGFFRLTGLEPGPTLLTGGATIGSRRFHGLVRATAGSTGVRLRLVEQEAPAPAPASASLELRVLGPDGEPVSDGCLTFTSASERRMKNTTGPLVCGRRAMSPEPGRHYIEVWLALDSRGRRIGAAVLGPLDTSPGEVIVRLPEEEKIEGRVVTPDGAGLPGVGLEACPVFDLGPLTQPQDHAWAKTDEDGGFVLRGLGELRYRLTLYATGSWSPPESLEFEAGTSGALVRLVPSTGPAEQEK